MSRGLQQQQESSSSGAMSSLTTTFSSGPPSTFSSPEFIKTVEWEMLDKRKFFPMSMASSFTVRCFLYPLTLVRTRLQVQFQSAVYRGTYDAFRKILKAEGVRGFYKGFWVSSFQVVSGICYVSTYEGVRHVLDKSSVVTNSMVRAFFGGACASVVGQTLIVPFDVISQHLMMMGQSNQLSIRTEGRSKAQLVGDVVREIYRTDGFRGYYRGYMASLFTYVPSSACWWTFYHFFQDFYGVVLPSQIVPHTLLQCLSATSSGCLTSTLTNPLDLVRTRVQVQRRPLIETVQRLWETERTGIFTKGLTARMTASSIYSLAVIFGYESVKRLSVYDEYKEMVRW